MKKILFITCITVLFIAMTVSAQKAETIYVSSDGSGTGESISSPARINDAAPDISPCYVYGGSTDTALPAGVNTHITMTGGVAESLFGGCESKSLTGTTYITLLGGEVTRRIYTGCYNDWYVACYECSYFNLTYRCP